MTCWCAPQLSLDKVDGNNVGLVSSSVVQDYTESRAETLEMSFLYQLSPTLYGVIMVTLPPSCQPMTRKPRSSRSVWTSFIIHVLLYLFLSPVRYLRIWRTFTGNISVSPKIDRISPCKGGLKTWCGDYQMLDG